MNLRNSTFGAWVACLLAASTLRAEPLPKACGSDAVQFSVKSQKGQSVLPALPVDGSAQLVFIESLDGTFMTAPTVRVGIDGEWVGATRGKSFYAMPVSPGVHTLCGSRQGGAQADKDNVSTRQISFEPGKVYYVVFELKRTSATPLRMAGDSGSPGSRTMNVDEAPTIDAASLTSVSEEVGRAALAKLPFAVPVKKR